MAHFATEMQVEVTCILSEWRLYESVGDLTLPPPLPPGDQCSSISLGPGVRRLGTETLPAHDGHETRGRKCPLLCCATNKWTGVEGHMGKLYLPLSWVVNLNNEV